VARGQTTPARVDVGVDVDAAGHVTRATAKSEEAPLAACIEKALGHVALRCAADGSAHAAHAVLHLTTFGPLGPKKR